MSRIPSHFLSSGASRPYSTASSYISYYNDAPANSTHSGKKASEWLRGHPAGRVCCVGYLWHPLSDGDDEYLRQVRMHDEARTLREKKFLSNLTSLSARLQHLKETKECLEETIQRLRRQSDSLECRQLGSFTVADRVKTDEVQTRTMTTALSCCEDQLKTVEQQYAELEEEQKFVQQNARPRVTFISPQAKNPYQTQSRWFSQDHLWDMHTALWIKLAPNHNLILEFTIEGLYLCEGSEAAERVKYFHSAGIDFQIPEPHQMMTNKILCDYIDTVQEWQYSTLTWNCQHFTGELYSNLVRGQYNVNNWYASRDFLCKKLSDRWNSDWGKPSGDPFKYGKELDWMSWPTFGFESRNWSR